MPKKTEIGRTVTKGEFFNLLAKKTRTTEKIARQLGEGFMDLIAQLTLKEDKVVLLGDFGKFARKVRRPRLIKSPITKGPVMSKGRVEVDYTPFCQCSAAAADATETKASA